MTNVRSASVAQSCDSAAMRRAIGVTSVCSPRAFTALDLGPLHSGAAPSSKAVVMHPSTAKFDAPFFNRKEQIERIGADFSTCGSAGSCSTWATCPCFSCVSRTMLPSENSSASMVHGRNVLIDMAEPRHAIGQPAAAPWRTPDGFLAGIRGFLHALERRYAPEWQGWRKVGSAPASGARGWRGCADPNCLLRRSRVRRGWALIAAPGGQLWRDVLVLVPVSPAGAF